MAQEGDLLLFALTKWRSMTWSQFRRSVDSLYKREAHDEDGPAVPIVRWSALRQLDALAHIDFFDEPLRAVTCQPTLARLPRAGLPTAVLCGSRAPQTVDEIRTATKSHPSARVASQRQVGVAWQPPTVISISAGSVETLNAIADGLGIPCPAGFPAFNIAQMMASVSDYVASREWRTGSPPNWVQASFDPECARWRSRIDADHVLRLVRYTHPATRQDQFWLWRSEWEYAYVDPDWGRYAVLANVGNRVLTRDSATGDVTHSGGAPLPTLAARALALCSGLAPTEEHLSLGTPGLQWFRRYPRVPHEIFDLIAHKLGQEKR